VTSAGCGSGHKICIRNIPKKNANQKERARQVGKNSETETESQSL